MGERVHGAAPLHHAGVRVVRGAQGQEVVLRLDGPGEPGCAHAGRDDLDLTGLGVEVIQDEEPAPGDEDDALAVGGGLAEVALLASEVGVGAEVGAVQGDGPEVRGGSVVDVRVLARGVRGEDQAVADEADAGLVRQQIVAQGFPGAFRVLLVWGVDGEGLVADPEAGGRSSLVVLPLVHVVAPHRHHHRGARRFVDDDLAAAAEREERGFGVRLVRVQSPELGVLLRLRGAMSGGDDDAAVRQPARHPGVLVAPEGDSAGGARAVGFNDVDLRKSRAPLGVGHEATVR
jgi:hypothetical protein